MYYKSLTSRIAKALIVEKFNSLSKIDRVRSVFTRQLSTKRLGIGGSKLAQSNHGDGRHASVIATSLQNGITCFESGHGGEEELRRAYTDAVMYLKDKGRESNQATDVIITGRFGYRTALTNEDKNFPNDVLVEDANSQDLPTNTILKNSNGETASDESTQEEKKEKVHHNLSRQYVSHCLTKSPLVELQKDQQNVHLIYMAHNPETQGVELSLKGAPLDDVREFVKERLTDAFVGLEIGVAENQIGSYGVCSNGLSLPSSHPLHLSWEDLLSAASDAVREVHGNSEGHNASLSTIQLPANLLETYGLTVATRMKQYLTSLDDKISNLPKSIQVFFTRPLTCYPDRGTGTGNPFKVVDYQIPTSLNDASAPTESTHCIKGATPAFYNPILNEVMGHFDATHLLEASEMEGRDLTVEERETLQGSRLLQSMIHDLDANLASGKLRSFAAYEEELYANVVPMIHNTFEELDETTVDLLQRFFKAHGLAVRQAIAKTTRQLLRTGEEGGNKHEIDEDQSLQEFALHFLLKQRCGDGDEGLLADRVIVGCPQPQYVIEAIKCAKKLN